MAETSSIEWTDATWNPITGCSVVSPGCTNCYAMRLAGTRLQHHPSRAGLTTASKGGPVWNGTVRLNEAWLDQPLQWKRPRRIFVCAHADLFHESVVDEWIDQVFARMALAGHHQFQVLTKRSARMLAYFEGDWKVRVAALIDVIKPSSLWNGSAYQATYELETHGFLPNVWVGVSAEDQARFDERVPDLQAVPAAVRFLSLEPLLGGIDATDRLAGIHWVIVGGENGPRLTHPHWVRAIQEACEAADVAFFFKQWGTWLPVLAFDTLRAPEHVLMDAAGRRGGDLDLDEDTAWFFLKVGKGAAGRELDGRTHNDMPRAA